jgi:hypothetical protein
LCGFFAIAHGSLNGYSSSVQKNNFNAAQAAKLTASNVPHAGKASCRARLLFQHNDAPRRTLRGIPATIFLFIDIHCA